MALRGPFCEKRTGDALRASFQQQHYADRARASQLRSLLATLRRRHWLLPLPPKVPGPIRRRMAVHGVHCRCSLRGEAEMMSDIGK